MSNFVQLTGAYDDRKKMIVNLAIVERIEDSKYGSILHYSSPEPHTISVKEKPVQIIAQSRWDEEMPEPTRLSELITLYKFWEEERRKAISREDPDQARFYLYCTSALNEIKDRTTEVLGNGDSE